MNTEAVGSAQSLRAANEMTIEEAFPKAEPGATPFGDRVLVQLRSPKKKTSSGLYIPAESTDTERWMTTIGLVIALGPLAFRDPETLKAWPEGSWAKVGDFVRVPKWGGDRWEVPLTDDEWGDTARFVIYRAKELIAGITGDPLRFRDYV